MPEVIVIKPKNEIADQIIRAAAYCRVSSDSDDQLNSFLSQVKHYTTLINEKDNHELVDIYADEGITGTQIKKRDEFNRLIRDCRKGKINRIYVKSISRFARNTIDSLETVRELKDIGVSVFFEEDNLDTATMSSEAILTLKSSIAQAESKSISQNMRLGARMRMKNGTFITNKVPYGYDYIDRELVINEEKAAIVRRIYRDYLDGYGIATIAVRLNKEGVPHSDNSKMWYSTIIRNILTNEKYIGDMMMQKTYRLDDIPYTKKINHGEVQRYYKHNTHDAIIDRETFMRVQRMLECKYAPHKKSDPTPEKPTLYKYIQCGCCGSTFSHRHDGDKTIWRCYYRKQNKNYCEVGQIAETVIESAFMDMYNRLKKNRKQILPPAISQLTAIQTKLRQNNTRIGEIDRQIAELNEQNHVISRLKSKGYLDNDDYMEQQAELNDKLKILRSRDCQSHQPKCRRS